LLPETDRAFALAKYTADRAHELELDRAAGAYEHGYFRGLFALNGAAIAGFAALLVKDGKLPSTGQGFTDLAVGCWVFGVCLAYIASWAAYEAQKAYVAALRARRHALGLDLLGRNHPTILGIFASDDTDSLLSRAKERQEAGDAQWKGAHSVGMISAGLFVVGVIFAINALRS
jgi:hypothetical protein